MRRPKKRDRVAAMAAVLAVTAALTACAAEEAADPEPRAPEAAAEEAGPRVLRGFLVLGEEVRSLKPCGEDRELWVVPVGTVTEAYGALAYEPSAPVFVEVEGTVAPAPESGPGAHYQGELRIASLRRAAPAAESRGCDEDVSGFAFRALGVEPFWSLEVRPASILYSTPELPRTVFEGASPMMASGAWSYESSAAGPERLGLRVRFAPETCRDSMVGAFYAWTATVEIGGETRTGCAYEGALAPG